ncbi:serine/threonine protein kinase [Streptomyces gobiensis]|uniref:serine/threonine protein kinase n=1 Tax=Streptomyces gobiensis TaxID=2875706 RepID=UPI001E6467C6|nr:serine/threonine protein kinase [Streptomyces gobiensis]UGY93174.1 serine/threonine protein kinase [Streptomyces gobiensis]
MDDYAGRLLAERYRLPRPPSEEYELRESRAYDTASGQEVLVRQVPLPEIVDAEMPGEHHEPGAARRPLGRATRRPADPAVRRAVEAALAASRIPDHPRLDQVFDVFVEDDGLWIVSELVAARPLAAVLAERPLSPHRAAEIAADLLAALSAVHTFGWTHRNITARSVLICDDGRALLTGLASGAAEEALCGYDPLPTEGPMAPGPLPPEDREAREANGEPVPHRAASSRATIAHRAARSGAIAAYRAGAAAARVAEEERAVHAPWGGDKPGPATTVPAQPERAIPDPQPQQTPAEWGTPEPGEDGRYRGPATALAAERARQARMTMVGPVTERWAPEQAGPVYENWRLAPPVGPAADLWAVGALLFRAVQGHAPYPEESVTDLAQLVCAEPPAFAEECGPLRPVIESLLRQDPTERPEFEELSGWLRSLVRSAPEPEVGRRTVTAQLPPESGGRDSRRLPIVRRRGELVRRRRNEKRPVRVAGSRHRRGRERSRQRPRSPRRLGRLLVSLVLVGLVAAIVYAMVFMPKAESSDSGANRRGSVGGGPSEGAPPPSPPAEPSPPQEPGSQTPQSTRPAPAPQGYTLQKDPAGFQIAVPKGWARGQTSGGQVRYSKGGLQMLVVPGRDSTAKYGTDPREYQLSDEPELSEYRDSNGWKTVSGVRSITVGETAMAEGEFSWKGSGGKTLLRNRAMILGGKYHVVLVRGPESQRTAIDEHFSQVVDTYRATG